MTKRDALRWPEEAEARLDTKQPRSRRRRRTLEIPAIRWPFPQRVSQARGVFLMFSGIAFSLRLVYFSLVVPQADDGLYEFGYQLNRAEFDLKLRYTVLPSWEVS